MFGFNELKKSVNDWTKNIKEKYEKELPIIDKIIELISQILNIWKSNSGYREYNQKILMYKSQYFNFSNFDLFYKNYLEIVKSETLEKLKEKGYNDFSAKLGIIKFLLKQYNYPITEIKELIEFLNFLQKYQFLIEQREKYKNNLILENYSLIYYNCLVISSYQKKYSELYKIIGKYEDIDIVLGPYGEKIKSGDPISFAFISSLETLLVNLENEKAIIEISYHSKKR